MWRYRSLCDVWALIEKGIITQQEFLQKIFEERETYQKLLNPVQH